MEDFLAFAIGVGLAIVPMWRIFSRAGMSPALSLLVVIPGLGWLIALGILALRDWPTVQPAALAGQTQE